jgi:Fe-S-cluster-containing dehydrogenase component
MPVMAILQNVDKCIRCNGCVIGCKRTWKMKVNEAYNGVHKVAPESRVMIKSQKAIDAGPFMRYSCWHCPDPPCARRCPKKAIKKETDGAVWVDHTLCDRTDPRCTKQCLTDCQRGGYPKIGAGTDMPITGKPVDALLMQKCTLCHDKVLNGEENPAGEFRIKSLPSKDPRRDAVVNPLNDTNIYNHQPSCVFTCPAKAMSYGTRDEILAEANGLLTAARALVDGGGNKVYPNADMWGDGSMFWFSSKPSVPPKADPFMEDHVSPMVGSLFSGPWGRAAVIPTLLATGLFAVVAHRAANGAKKSEEVA